VRPEADVREVFRLHNLGVAQFAISAATGVSVTQIKRWLRAGEQSVLNSRGRSGDCSGPSRCRLTSDPPHEPYAYLLGQYLGDGHIVHNHRGVYRLEVACCAAYTNIVEECASAISQVLPSCRVGRRRNPGVIRLGCYSRHLPCLFPQHGLGPKHLRPIVLQRWQEQIVLDQCPASFVRGLLHSDGCRSLNRVRGTNGVTYEYWRYQFSNRSEDIEQLFCHACDRLGIEWRRMNEFAISVARRGSVALLDELVGSKS
jgi:hypothetical protein